MRRKPEFPTRDEWLARRGLEQPEPRLEQASPSEATGTGTDVQTDEQASLGSDQAKPVISFRPKRPYWR